MPDGIIGIAIDIGLIREAQRRIALRKLQKSTTDQLEAFRKCTIEPIRRMIESLRAETEKEQEEPDAT